MNSDDLKQRTMDFALRVIELVRALPDEKGTGRLKDQLFGSSTSTAANYRACCRARSKKEFISKIGLVIEECDETLFWLELVVQAKLFPAEKVASLIEEANELTAIFTSSQITARRNLNR